jgi:RAD54-like protein 2
MDQPDESASAPADDDLTTEKTDKEPTEESSEPMEVDKEVNDPAAEAPKDTEGNNKRVHAESPPAPDDDADEEAAAKKLKTSDEPTEQVENVEQVEQAEPAAPQPTTSQFSHHSVDNFLPSPAAESKKSEDTSPVEKPDIDLAEIIGGSDDLGEHKAVELAEILENPDDLLKESTDDDKSRNDSMDFDISEKLREMGEISVKPISKAEFSNKKAESGEGGEDVSFEISKKDNLLDRKVTNMRKNIREVMDDTQLDASTLAAQRQEQERLARVQEQQRIIRDVQRQIAAERQSNKTQARVLSLLQGHSSRSQASGSSTTVTGLPQTSGATITKISAQHVRDRLSSDALKKAENITPSVSIAQIRVPTKRPEAKKKRPADQFDEDEEEDEDYDEDYDEDFDEDDESTMGSMSTARRPVSSESTTATIVKKDVVTIDSSSDDDCIVLSDDEEEEEEIDDDPNNSGLHVNDTYNVPDDQGRVLINFGHPEGEEDLFLAPQIARIIKPHQIGGVRFLFDNLIESIDRFDQSTGYGCILSHSM